jgi:hypothetical protein
MPGSRRTWPNHCGSFAGQASRVRLLMRLPW